MQTFPKFLGDNDKIVKTSLLFLYLIPLLALIGFVFHLGVNIPFADQWALLPYFEKVQAGKVTLLDLFKQHNEHRIVLPRLVFSLLAFSTDWNTRSEMALSIVIASVSFLCLFGISSKTFKICFSQLSRSSYSVLFHTVNFFSCCLMFSWVQRENWLWGFQIPWFFINACLILTILVLQQDNIRSGWRLTGAAVLCLMASFSSAHGLFVWLAVIPSVMVIAGNVKQKIAQLTIWALMFVTCLMVYLIGYQKPPHAQEFYTTSLGNYIGHFFVAIGAPLIGKHSWLGRYAFSNRYLDGLILVITGLFIFLSFLAIGIYVLLGVKRENKISHLFIMTAPWFSLGAYSIIFSLVTSYGRSGYSIEQSLSSRYTTPNILILIALLQLVPILMSHWRMSVNKIVAVGAIAFFCVLQVKTATGAMQESTYSPYGTVALEKQMLCAELVVYMDDGGLAKCLENNPSANRERIIRLSHLGFRKPLEDIAFTDVSALLDSDEMVSVPSMVISRFDAQSASMFGKITFPDTSTLLSRPRAVLVSVGNKKTFSALAHLNLRISKHNQLLWQVQLSQETVDKIVLNNQTLDLYLYYPTRKEFVRMYVETSVDDEIK